MVLLTLELAHKRQLLVVLVAEAVTIQVVRQEIRLAQVHHKEIMVEVIHQVLLVIMQVQVAVERMRWA